MFNEARLKEVVGTVLGIDPLLVGPESNSDNIESWDSLRHMSLVLALEEEFGVSIPDEDVANITSYSLIRLVLGELLGN